VLDIRLCQENCHEEREHFEGILRCTGYSQPAYAINIMCLYHIIYHINIIEIIDII
jgi:hypothetical protein